jgi:putative transposase
VFGPKYRRKVLTPLIDQRLQEIACRVAQEIRSTILEMQVMPDHVHILCKVDTQYGIGKFVRRVKGRSSRLLRQEFPKLKSRLPTLWTNSVFCTTTGGAPLSVIKHYIENQKRR